MLELYGLKIKLHKKVYEPDDDSFLLADYLIGLDLKGKDVLEIGTGTGLQALICSRKGGNVTATDINPYALKITEENAGLNDLKIDVLKSNLFENINNKKFDYIIFNTPYLPEDMNFRDIYSKSWDGGRDGRKIIDLFLKQVFNYLKPDSVLILVQSSLSDIDKTLNILKKKTKNISVISKKFDFETIYLVDAKIKKE